MYVDQGKLDHARHTCNDAIGIFREQGARRGEGWALMVLGDVARKMRKLGDARSYYNEALAIFNSMGDRADQARVLNALGAVSQGESEYPEAKEHFEHAYAIAHEQESLQLEGRALRGLGDVARAMRQLSEADHEGQVLPQSMGIPRAGARLPESRSEPTQEPAFPLRRGRLEAWKERENLRGLSPGSIQGTTSY